MPHEQTHHPQRRMLQMEQHDPFKACNAHSHTKPNQACFTSCLRKPMKSAGCNAFTNSINQFAGDDHSVKEGTRDTMWAAAYQVQRIPLHTHRSSVGAALKG